MKKEKIILEDGRYLIYYTFERSARTKSACCKDSDSAPAPGCQPATCKCQGGSK